MAIYDEMQKVALEVLSDPEFKQGDIKYVRVVPGSGPAHNPGPSTFQTVDAPGGVAKGASFKYVQSGLALSTDLIVTLPVIAGVTPNTRDFIQIDGTRYKIMHDISTPAAGTRVVWKFIIQKG